MSMAKKQIEKQNQMSQARGIRLGIAATLTSSFFLSLGTDPVNLPKFVILGATSLFLLGTMVGQVKNEIEKTPKLFTVFLSLFVLALLNTLVFSNAPLTHQIYGVSGRNLGFLTYFFFAGLALYASTIGKAGAVKVVYSFLISGLIASFISALEIAGLNPLNINNTFGSIVGTLGNPNFISSFLGMVFNVAISLTLISGLSFRFKGALFIFSILVFALILETHSKQGLMIMIIGLALIFYALIQKNLKKVFSYVYASIICSLGAIGLFGLVNKGPFAKLVFESSVEYRFEYWKAGIRMLVEHSYTGVGLNTFGDWYRSSRSQESLASPGSEVVTNASHNVFIDYAANGGAPLVMAALLVFGYTFIKSLKKFLTMKEQDPFFLALFVAWAGYMLQTMISIDQIGLTIWGWVFTGLLLSFCKNEDSAAPNDQKIQTQVVPEKISQGLLSPKSLLSGYVGGILGLVMTFPAIKVDLDWSEAMRSGNPSQILSVAMQYPLDENRIGTATLIFLQNGLGPEAARLITVGRKEFPRSFSIWRMQFQSPYSTKEEKIYAQKMMTLLDPLNSNL